MILENFDVVGNVFLFGADENLDREGERIKETGIGIDGGFLFFFGKQVEVDGIDPKNDGGGAGAKQNEVVGDVENIEMLLGGGGDGSRARHNV